MKLDAKKWKILSGVLIITSSYIASVLVQKTWKTIGDGRAPDHPRLPTADLKTSLVVAGLTGVTSAALKFAAIRLIGRKWQHVGGELPDQ